MLADADQVIEADYVLPYLAHAPMEPLDGLLRWDGRPRLARFGSRMQTVDQPRIAAVLGITPDKVAIETMLAGGSFGRRGQFDAHLANEMAHVAKATSRPAGEARLDPRGRHPGRFYRPDLLHPCAASPEGQIRGLERHRRRRVLILGTAYEASGPTRVDVTMVEGAQSRPTRCANFRCDVHTASRRADPLVARGGQHPDRLCRSSAP